jgi:hypothetical protein
MASAARGAFTIQLRDFDEIITARDAICSHGADRPAQRRGAAVTRAAVVMLSVSFGSYVDGLYDLAVDQLLSSYSNAHRNSLKNKTSKRWENATVSKLTKRFLNLGIPWIMEDSRIHWQKFSNAPVWNILDEIVNVRNSNAHGTPRMVGKLAAIKWKDALEELADKLDEIVADHIDQETGIRPW